jgi:hypothetical protein
MMGAMTRRRAKGSPATTETPVGHLARAATWSGIRAGDAVVVEGTRLRAATWTFVAHVTNTQSGDEWVEVVGGRPGARLLRSFRPEQVFPPQGRGAGRGRGPASLADAPQLPFD